MTPSRLASKRKGACVLADLPLSGEVKSVSDGFVHSTPISYKT